MNDLLLFFALPIAVIIMSIALQKIFKCPFLVSGIIFSTFLVITFATENINMLILTIIYTIISYITAFLLNIIYKINKKLNFNNSCCNDFGNMNGKCECKNDNELLKISSKCYNNQNGKLLTISSDCCDGTEQELLTIDSSINRNNNCNCKWNCDMIPNQRGITDRVNDISNYYDGNEKDNYRRCRRRH